MSSSGTLSRWSLWARRRSGCAGIWRSAVQRWVRDDGFGSRGLTPSSDLDERREAVAALRRIRGLEMEDEVVRRAAACLSQACVKSPR